MSGTEDVVDKLDVLIRLVAIGLCGDKKQKDKIQLLSSAGLQPKAIADLIGTTPNTVNVALSGLRKTAKKKRATTKRATKRSTNGD